MKSIDMYLKNMGVDISLLTSEEYQKLENLHTNWSENNKSAYAVLGKTSYSQNTDSIRYIEFARKASFYQALLENEVEKIKAKTRKRN